MSTPLIARAFALDAGGGGVIEHGARFAATLSLGAAGPLPLYNLVAVIALPHAVVFYNNASRGSVSAVNLAPSSALLSYDVAAHALRIEYPLIARPTDDDGTVLRVHLDLLARDIVSGARLPFAVTVGASPVASGDARASFTETFYLYAAQHEVLDVVLVSTEDPATSGDEVFLGEIFTVACRIRYPISTFPFRRF